MRNIDEARAMLERRGFAIEAAQGGGGTDYFMVLENARGAIWATSQSFDSGDVPDYSAPALEDYCLSVYIGGDGSTHNPAAMINSGLGMSLAGAVTVAESMLLGALEIVAKGYGHVSSIKN